MLKRYSVKNNYIYDKNELKRSIIIPTVNILGEYRDTEIIKQMYSNKHIYEARVTQSKYDHPRILLFVTTNKNLDEEINLSSVLFTFYFLKILDGEQDTETQPLINETASIRNCYFLEDFDYEIIGKMVEGKDVRQ